MCRISEKDVTWSPVFWGFCGSGPRCGLSAMSALNLLGPRCAGGIGGWVWGLNVLHDCLEGKGLKGPRRGKSAAVTGKNLKLI